MIRLTPKRRTPLKRSRKPIKRKAKFKANLNPFKVYKARHSPEQVRAFAARCREERLKDPTAAEDAFAGILRNLGVVFEREYVIFHSEGTRFVIADFWLPHHKIVLETDGSSHQLQDRYDKGRDQFLASFGVRTYRFTNTEVLRRPNVVSDRIVGILTGNAV